MQIANRNLIWLLVALFIPLAGCHCVAAQGIGKPFVIRTTLDAGKSSLRNAIAYANGHESTRIVFQIPAIDAGYEPKTGGFVIQLRSPLPPIVAGGTVIDGGTESLFLKSGAAPNQIAISGSELPVDTAIFTISASDCEVKNLIFQNSHGPALLLTGRRTRSNEISGNLFEGNQGGGIVVAAGAGDNRIGTTGNLFRDNGEADLRIESDLSLGNTVQSNRFEGEEAPIRLPALLRKSIPAPTIVAMNRLPRTDGLWNEIVVTYNGRPNQTYILDLSWDAEVAAENGQGTRRFKLERVRTDAQGSAEWKMVVKGYPAGKMRANVTDEQGTTSEMSPVFDVPWLY